MREPTEIMMWRVSEKMADIISTEYLLGGSSVASVWSVGDSEFDKECSQLAPGSLVLLFREKDSRYSIIGGGYFLEWVSFNVKESWDLYGVKNGATSYEEFLKAVEERGGSETGALSSAKLMHTFVFNPADYITIPDELNNLLEAKQHFKLDTHEPAGHFIENRVLEMRDGYIGNDGNDWQGMYYVASHRNSKAYMAAFHARVMDAYKYQCALTGVKARPVLMIAHIQPFYDAQFQSVSNGVVLRSDIYNMFKAGYITFMYNDKGDKLITKVSETVSATGGADYMQYDGCELMLPEDKSLWPNKRYMLWHNRKCFESWLRIGGTHVQWLSKVQLTSTLGFKRYYV